MATDITPQADEQTRLTPTPEHMNDLATRILYFAPGLQDSHRADLLDLYHASKDATELAGHLAQLPLNPKLKGSLLSAKNRDIKAQIDAAPKEHPAIIAINRMAAMDPTMLAVAENHPNLLKAFVAQIDAEK